MTYPTVFLDIINHQIKAERVWLCEAFLGSVGRFKQFPFILILHLPWCKLQFLGRNSETFHIARYISWAAWEQVSEFGPKNCGLQKQAWSVFLKISWSFGVPSIKKTMSILTMFPISMYFWESNWSGLRISNEFLHLRGDLLRAWLGVGVGLVYSSQMGVTKIFHTVFDFYWW